MKLFGSITELVAAVFRKNSQAITLRPNQATTYTAARDVQLPPEDAASVLVSNTATQPLTNKTINADLNTISNIDDNEIKALAGIDASKIADGSVSNAEFQALNGVAGALVDTTSAQTLSNKSLVDASTFIVDDGDATKKLQLQVSGITTGTTRTLTVPDASDTIAVLNTTQTLINKTIDADLNTLSNIENADIKALAAIDATKLADGSVDNTEFQRLNSAGSAGAGNLVTTDGTQVLTNKDVDGGTASNAHRITVPKDTLANLTALTRKQGTIAYATDITTLVADDGSTLVPVGSGSGAGEINAILNPSAATAITGWVGSNGSSTATRTTTASELPLGPIITSAIKLDFTSPTGLVHYRFTMPDALKNTKLKLQWYQRQLAAYTTNAVQVSLHTNTLANYTGTDVQLALSSDNAGSTYVIGADGQFTAYFDADGSDYYELVFIRNNFTSSFSLANVVVGPGIQAQGAGPSAPVDFTPIWNNATPSGTDSAASYARDGEYMLLQFATKFSAGGAATSLTLNMPAGLNVNTAHASLFTAAGGQFGTGIWSNSGSSDGMSATLGGVTNQLTFVRSNNGAAIIGSNINPNDFMNGSFRIPIAEWAGGGTLRLAENAVEYAYNTNQASDADDLTSFGYGELGIGFPTTSFSQYRFRRVRFTSPVLSTDVLTLQVQASGTGKWITMDTDTILFDTNFHTPFRLQAGVYTGIGISSILVNDTDVNVIFGQYSSPGATYGSGVNWGSATSTRWRLKKTSANAALGFAAATSSSMGLAGPAGKYTPVVTNINNITSTSVSDAFYTRIGTIVHVQGSIDVNAAGAASTEFSLTLPVTSNFTVATDSSGIVTEKEDNLAGEIHAITSSSTVKVSYTSPGAGNRTVRYSYMYEIK